MKHTKTTLKFFIGMLAAILISGTASAQHGNSPAGRVILGIKGGVNVYNVNNDNNINYDPRMDLTLVYLAISI